jgi:ParB family transcriptional regulator, chromosome partitioning protein
MLVRGALPEVVRVEVPEGLLRYLKIDEVVPNPNNPRRLFDPGPLSELKENIREHGVLVPITVYLPKGSTKYHILDGQRRHRCCVELGREGHTIDIPANIVHPPDKLAGLIYMFNIHNFREAWELMPTALSLREVMNELNATDEAELTRITGLSGAQVRRCLILLKFPDRFQKLSLDPDPSTRIPSNFWIEAEPVITLAEKECHELAKELGGRDGLTDRLVEKYRSGAIKSVIHFRYVMEAYDNAESHEARGLVLRQVDRYFREIPQETRRIFDEYVVETRHVNSAVRACNEFIGQLQRLKLFNVVNRGDLTTVLRSVKEYVDQLLQKLEEVDRADPPLEEDQP